MQYISGAHALNMSELRAPRVWIKDELDWEEPELHDTRDYPFGDWGIKTLDEPIQGIKFMANHARAYLDMIYDGQYETARGMKEYAPYATVDTLDMYEQVYKMRWCSSWNKIDDFMTREYSWHWKWYKKRRG